MFSEAFCKDTTANLQSFPAVRFNCFADSLPISSQPTRQIQYTAMANVPGHVLSRHMMFHDSKPLGKDNTALSVNKFKIPEAPLYFFIQLSIHCISIKTQH